MLEDDNGGASVELNEPDHAGVGGAFSLWYLWTAPTSGPVWFSAQVLADGYAMDALSAYTGNSLATLVATASGAGRPLIFNAVAGSEYRIAVDTEAFGTPSAFRLSWLQAGPPLNDHLANAATLVGNSGQLTALLLGATQESAEIIQFSALESADAKSVWYRWTAPSNGVFVLQNTNQRTVANFHQVNGLGDYPFFSIAADNGAALTVGASTGQVLTFRVSADPLFVPQVGISYVFRANASAFKIGTGPRLRERLAESRTVTVIRDVGDLTKAATVTIAPTTGAGFAVVGTDFTLSPTTLTFAPGETVKVFTVTAINNAVNSGNKMLHLNLTAGSNAVITTGLSAGEIIDDEDDPVNNLLSNATILSGQTGAANGTTIGADRDDSDPGYSPAPAVLASAPDYTVWFQWTSPADGNFTVSTLGSTNATPAEFDAVLGIYSGVALNSLTPLPGTPQDIVLEESMTVAVTAGTSYYIQVGGYNNEAAANILLNWSFAATIYQADILTFGPGALVGPALSLARC